MFNPIMLTAARSSLTILIIFGKPKSYSKIFDGEMSVRTVPTTLLQIFCKTILTFKVIVKGIIDPDDNFWRKVLALKY